MSQFPETFWQEAKYAHARKTDFLAPKRKSIVTTEIEKTPFYRAHWVLDFLAVCMSYK